MRCMEGVLGGWRLVGINTLTSGVPINLSYSPTAAFIVSGSPTYRPNLTGDPLTPRTAASSQLPEPGDGRRSRPTGRSRSATRRATSPAARLHAVRPRPAQVVRPRPRQHPPRAAHRGVQPVQPHELQHAERESLEQQLRHDHLDVSGQADSAGSEGAFLIDVNSQLPTANFQGTPNSQLPSIGSWWLGSWKLGVPWSLGVGSWELTPTLRTATCRPPPSRSPPPRRRRVPQAPRASCA